MNPIKKILAFVKKRICWRSYIKNLFRKNGSQIKKTDELLNPQFVNVGRNTLIFEHSRIMCYKKYCNKEYAPSLVFGNNVIVGPHFTAVISDRCSIGDNTMIAHNVSIITSNHGTDISSDKCFREQDLQTKEIFIGNNCWVGCNVVFLPGSRVGDNCVVAAGAIVNKQFPDNSLIGGVPAKVLKRFNTDKKEWENQLN